MVLPDPMAVFFRGDPLHGDQIEYMVMARVAAWRPAYRREFDAEGGFIVLHPQVLEEVVMAELGKRDRGERTAWSHEWTNDGPVTRLRAWRVETDPCLRYDEVRLRREEVLTHDHEH